MIARFTRAIPAIGETPCRTLAARYRQAHREARWAVGLAVAYFIWWYVSAYAFSPDPLTTEMPSLCWGFPLWFLLACVIGPPRFHTIMRPMVKQTLPVRCRWSLETSL
ncbi:YhdT family protein [Vibrio sp. PP-XX7]